MEQYEPDRLSPAQLAAAHRTLTSGRGAFGRRALLRTAGLGALTVGGLATLTGCGIPAAKRDGGAPVSDDHSAKEKEINFSNWTEYMDVTDDGKHRPTLEAFTRRTGIKVKYTEDINDNVEFFGKIKPQLAAGQDTGRDLIILTDWLAARLIRFGWVERLDSSLLPHAYANLSAQFRSPDWDPGRAYSYPWAGIPTVIAYNSKATGGRKVDSVTQLLDDPKLKGRVSFLSEMRDSVGMTLLDMGKDPAKVTDADYDAAIGRLQKGVDRNQIRRFTGNDYISDLDKGDIAACVAWGGDITQLQHDNPHVKYVIPAAGYMTSTDNMMIPVKARHTANAERLIDYYYEPAVAAKLTAYTNYVCPVDGVREELTKIDPAMAANELILPDKAMAARSHSFRSLSSKEETAYEEKFAKLIGT
ncbi:polyamine ABC transporter substrate-binding protein [Streptomyces sp. NBC_01766]|uniref:polyamine ABC transporter substrate-binding protein n=1 Tax=Streptomyces sp. NBC_01766 TaxID=2975936 RepID=UPI002DDB073B|nr:spermidine/putrescine ABC transporter substrate-binding protein [Streptomyces sp. NBC_01766]WSC19537.1 spermidine/putrescine ABC transporter substrate-binding protein [Streptomyces sp. NBC_01766]